jgi:outer membrane receptor for ferrienterochelin and colicins
MKSVSICVIVLLLISLNSIAQQDTPTVKQLDEVVVTGQFQPQSVKHSVYKIRTISQERIKLRAATDLAGVLNNELGIRFSTDFALGETDISIMGMSGQNVKILLDGVPLVDRGSTKQSLSQIDINTVERIEIVEGPMSVVYGTDALAGVVNIITKKNKAGTHLSVSARVQEESLGKEYDPFTDQGVHNENIAVNWNNKMFNAGASITRNNMGGWQGDSKGRTKDWRPKDQTLASGTIGYQHGKLNAWYRLNYLDETITAAGPANPDNTATDQEFITSRFTHQAQADFRASNRLNLNASFSYQDYERRTRTTDINLVTNKRTLNVNLAGGQDIAKFSSIFFRGTATYKVSEMVSLQPGVEIKIDESTGQRIKGNPSIGDYSFFISSEIKPNSWINIRPGLRFSENSVYDAPPVIPSINTKFTISKNWDLRASYARGFRAPALRELYFDFHDANHSINGNTNLKAEYSNSFNASLTWRQAKDHPVTISSTLSGFYNEFDNQITTALANDPNDPNLYTYINVDKFKTTGATLENSLAWKNLSVNIGLFYIGRYNRYSDDPAYKTEDLPGFTWSPEINSNIVYRFPKLGASAGVFYKYTGKTPSYQIAVVNAQQVISLVEVEAYHWADITLTKNIGKYLVASGGLKNLFDITRIQNTASSGGVHSSGGPILTATGRSWFLGLAFQFLKK